jgi:hypothetical protein
MKKDNIFLLLIFLLIGLILGEIIGDYLSKYIEILNYSKSIGLNNFNLDLSIISLTFGFKMKLSLASVLGLFLAIILYRKL